MSILHTSTIFARRHNPILNHLTSINSLLTSHPSLFTLSASPSTSPSTLQNIVNVFTSYDSAVGCLSAPLIDSLAGVDDNHNYNGELIACSIAVFDASSAVPFRSTIQGREQPQVGRWHRPRPLQSTTVFNSSSSSFDLSKLRSSSPSGVNWDDVWATENNAATANALPEEIQGLEYVLSLNK